MAHSGRANMADLIASVPPDTFFTIPVERLGPAGIRGELHFIAQFPGDSRSDASRIGNTSERHFKINGLLSKAPLPADRISVNFTANDGGSYLIMPESAVEVHVDSSWGKYIIKPNDAGELSLIEFECNATSIRETP